MTSRSHQPRVLYFRARNDLGYKKTQSDSGTCPTGSLWLTVKQKGGDVWHYSALLCVKTLMLGEKQIRAHRAQTPTSSSRLCFLLVNESFLGGGRKKR